MYEPVNTGCRACIHGISNPANWSLFENVFLTELVLSGRNDESLRKSFGIFDLHRNKSKHVHSLLAIIILESSTTNLKSTVNNSKTNVGIVASHSEIRSGSD